MDDDLSAELDYQMAEAELVLARHAPLDTKLECHIKAQTMSRLQEYLAVRKVSLDQAIEHMINSILYDQGF